MALTVREQIVAKIVDLVDALDGVTVYRNHASEIDRVACPAVNVLAGGHIWRPTDVQETEFVMSLQCDCYEKGATSETAEIALHALYGRVVQALLADRTVGGFARDIVETELSDPEITDEEGAATTMAAAIVFEITFATAEGDPFTQA